jgi:formylmethanofuran dehydrogenase subunit E
MKDNKSIIFFLNSVVIMPSENSKENTKMQIPAFEEAAKFHRHVCPGHIIGYISSKLLKS